jgi:hypothetical protein
MEPLFGLVAAAITMSVAFLVSSERRRARLRAWRQAAQRVGLARVEEAEGGFFEGGFLLGHAGDLHVRLESYHRGKYENGTRIVVSGFGHGAGGLSLRREGLSTAIERRFVGEREIEVGDRSFDDEYYVQGRAPLALALLDPETRRLLGGLLRGQVSGVDVDASLGDGVLEVRFKESGFTGNRERAPLILEGVLDVARRLVAPVDVAARLAVNLPTEPRPGARLQAVLVLAREFPDHPATREALRSRLQDESREVRLRAAMALGDEGRATLLDLVEGAGADDSVAARAVSSLGSGLPAERVEAVLGRALGGQGRTQTAKACLEALAVKESPRAEGLMLGALRHEDEDVALAATRALGRAGTVASVPALREAAEARSGLRGPVRQAIAEIQARLDRAEPGQLSLAGGEAGALSLAADAGEPGRLSLAETATGAPIAWEEFEEERGAGTRPKREGDRSGVSGPPSR